MNELYIKDLETFAKDNQIQLEDLCPYLLNADGKFCDESCDKAGCPTSSEVKALWEESLTVC